MRITLKETLMPEQLKQHLHEIGERYYHDKHPFHRLLHTGELGRGQVQAWALNRYCYQAIIPIKDTYLMARMPCNVMRREWRQRIEDHDGSETSGGGIERWLKLTDGLGLIRDYVISQDGALPASKFSADAYVRFVSERPLLEAIASSLTEIFSPTIIAERVSGMLKNYDFITEETLAYFKPRLTQARRDVDFALQYVLDHAHTIDEQEGVLNALRFKCDILWSQLDALYFSYVEPCLVPPDCFVPNER